MPIGFIFIFLVFVAIMIVCGIFSHQQQKERQATLTQLANDLGWSYDPGQDSTHENQYSQFDLFTTGQSRYAYNTLRGTLTIDDALWHTVSGDYHYTTTSGTGKNRKTTTHQFSYLIVTHAYSPVPDLKIRREGLFDKLASFIGFDDIDFESAEFSDRFHIKSTDKRFAYDVLHPRMMEFLLADEPPTIYLQGQHCCVQTAGCWTAEEFRANMVWMQAFFSNWPRHLSSPIKIQRPQ